MFLRYVNGRRSEQKNLSCVIDFIVFHGRYIRLLKLLSTANSLPSVIVWDYFRRSDKLKLKVLNSAFKYEQLDLIFEWGFGQRRLRLVNAGYEDGHRMLTKSRPRVSSHSKANAK
jgi:hypothetical protein